MCSNVNKMAKQSDHSHTKSKNKQRPKIPQCEVVNEIQIVSNKKDNQHNSNIATTTTTPTPTDNIKDKNKNCRSSSTDISVTTPTTVTTSTTVPIAKSRSRDKDKSGGNICMCGKLLKRVKGILDRKDKKDGSKYHNMTLYVNFLHSLFILKYVSMCECVCE